MSRLLSLPTELRQIIWKYIIPRDGDVKYSIDQKYKLVNGEYRLSDLRFTWEGTTHFDSDDERHAYAYRYGGVSRSSETRDTCALFKLDRQTAAEAWEIFYTGNTFTFSLNVSDGYYDEQMPKWPFSAHVSAAMRRVRIELPWSCWLEETPFKIAKECLTIISDGLSGCQASSTSSTMRALPPLQHLKVYMEGHDGWACDCCARGRYIDATPYLLEPLAASTSRKVSNVEFEAESGEDAYAVGVFNFVNKMKRVLEDGIILQEQGQGQVDADYLASKYQWDSVVVADQAGNESVAEAGVGEQEKSSEVNQTGEASTVKNGGENRDNMTVFEGEVVDETPSDD